MKKLLFILLGICACVQAQVGCPQRIVKGDPRNHGQEEQMMQADHQRRIAQAEQEAMSSPAIGTRTIPPRVLVIMVQFKDYAFSTTKAHADSIFNARTPLTTDRGYYATYYGEEQIVSHGSVASYFEAQSLGQYRPKFDIVGPVTLTNSYKDFPHTTGGPSLANKACTAVNDSVDFTQYDNDKDGYIDMVFVLFAGFGQNDSLYVDKTLVPDVSKLIWPHYSSGGSGKFDGKTLRAYECSNELDGYYSYNGFLVPAGSGILVHEFSHGMGLPDVYLGGTQFMGTWDLMDYGCYNCGSYVPASYNGYQRWFCGWSKPKMMNIAKNDTLRPITESGDFGVIATSGSVSDYHNNNTEYWIIENHQGLGWDAYSYGKGMILFHMKHHNSWGTSTNANNQKGCILLPADGSLRDQYGYVGKQDDCYPYGNLDSIKIASNYPITAIKQESNGNITFKVCGGAPDPTTRLEEPNGEEAKWLKGEKVIVNGVMYIRRGNKLYTITGNEAHIL